MNPVEPSCFVGSHQIVMLKNGDESTPMVAALDDDGLVLTEWALTPLDVERLLSGGHLRVWMRLRGADDFPPIDLEIGDPSPKEES